MRLIFASIHSAYAQPRLIEYLRSISSGAKSVSAVPSRTDPWRLLDPETKASASTRVVFPLAPCPTTATLRISELLYSRMVGLRCFGLSPRRRRRAWPVIVAHRAHPGCDLPLRYASPRSGALARETAIS